MTTVAFEYRPLAVHAPFHESRARHRAAVGGYGSGKSWAAVAEMQKWGLEQPGSEFLITRKTVPSLKITTEQFFVDQLPRAFLDLCHIKRAGGHIESLEFPNGSLYHFRGMDDWRKLRSLNLAGILYDEGDEFTQEEFEGMKSRLRQSRPTRRARELGYTSINRWGTVIACNPRGKNWIWQDFVGPDRKKDTECFISTTLDNPYHPVSYVDDLLAMPAPWVRAFVLCKFDDLVGAIYPEWTHERHLIAPLRGVDGRYRYDPAGFFMQSFDPGTASGNASLWCYYDKPNHRVVGIAEYNETGLAASVHADAWRRLEARHAMRTVRTRIADPKAITVRDRGSNTTLYDQYRRFGFRFAEGTNSVETRVHSLGQLIHTGRFVVTEDCPMAFEQIKNYRWEDLTPRQMEMGREAKPFKRNVDLVDCAQYVACRYIGPPKTVVHASAQEAEAYEVTRAIRRQLADKRTATTPHDLGTICV